MACRVTSRLLVAALLTLVLWPGAAVRAQGDTGAAAGATATAASAVSPATPASAELERMRAELRQQQELVLLMRHRLAEAESARAWLPWLGLGLAASTVLALWLGAQWARSQRSAASRRDSHPQAHGAGAPAGSGAAMAADAARHAAAPADAAAAGGAGPAPRLHRAGLGAEPLPADRPGDRKFADGRWGAQAMPTTTAAAMGAYEADPTTHTQPAVAAPRAPEPPALASELSLSGQPPRAVTVEELLDLEQQVDFFMVLGQEDSAIDLLVSHIRSTGGTSALPYLKLLEVYRHQGNAEGYERTRERFNQRFNAFAPDWSGDPMAGRQLEDYPGVLERLQRAWRSPGDSMVELESLLFRRHQGELFDLPAYRELLMLYAVARDLFDLAPSASTPIDVLLPLDDEQQDTTSPRPHLGLFSDDALGSRTAEWARINERPVPPVQHHAADRTMALRTAELPPPRIDLDMALDIDLSEFSPAPREFTQPAAFNDIDLSRSDFTSLDEPPLPPQRG